MEMTPDNQGMEITPGDQGMEITPDDQGMEMTPDDQGMEMTPDMPSISFSSSSSIFSIPSQWYLQNLLHCIRQMPGLWKRLTDVVHVVRRSSHSVSGHYCHIHNEIKQKMTELATTSKPMPEMTAIEELAELLQSAHDTIEGIAFSPDSGVSSCSDSEPSSPTFTSHFTHLTNADPSAYQVSDCNGVSPEWTQSSYHQHQAHYWSMDYQWEFPQNQLPACVSEEVSDSTAIKGGWVETKAGFHVRATGNGNVQVKLGSGDPYDIDLNIDIPLPDTSLATVKTEAISDSTSVTQYEEEHKYMPRSTDVNINHNNNIDGNNNNNNNCIMNNSAMSTMTYQEGGCNNCYHYNTSSTYGTNQCPSYHTGLHHQYPQVESPDGRLPLRKRSSVTRTERLWEFILRLLGDSKHNPRLIEWVDREDGTFRLNNSKAIAYMWGMRKNNKLMTYEKLSRALRYYYQRQTLEPVLGKKLVYRFGPNAEQVWRHRPYRPQGAR